jgi:hypothetical protein
MNANNISFSNGNGLDFSATAGGGATSSVLADYEEGTWTPAFFGGTPAPGLAASFGRYIKTGKYVYVWGRIESNSVGGATITQISGLPYGGALVTIALLTDTSVSGFAVTYFTALGTATTSIVGGIDPLNNTRISLYRVGAAATGVSGVFGTLFPSGAIIEFSGWYRSTT